MGMDVGVGGKVKVKPDMNVTPLVDVVLVLLIIFMVLAPVMTEAFNVRLPPKDDKDEQLDQVNDADKPLVLSVGDDGSVEVNTVALDRAELPERLRRMFNARPDNVLYLDGGVVLTSPTTTRPQLAGYTSTLYTGAFGSRVVGNQICDAQFPGSHLCNEGEFRLSRPNITLGAPGAFLDYASSTNVTDPSPSVPCNNFSSTLTYSVPIALPNGSIVTNSTSSPNCASSLPLACCD